MPLHTSRNGIIDVALTGIFQERAKDLAAYKALRIAPTIDINAIGGQITIADQNNEMNLAENPNFDKALGDNSTAKVATVQDSIIEVSLEPDAYKSFVSHAIAKSSEYLNTGYSRRSMDKLILHALQRLEIVTGRALGDASNFGTTASPGNYNTSSTALFDPINAGINAIGEATGFAPNKIIMNSAVFRKLQAQDEVKAWNGRFTNNASAPASKKALQQLFLDMFDLELEVMNSYYTPKSGAANRTTMLKNNIILTRTANDQSTSWANTFTNNWLSGMGAQGVPLFGVRQYPSYDPYGITYQAEGMYKFKVVGINAGYALIDVLS